VIPISTRDSGSAGEKIAERYLRIHGYRILQRNFRCPAGEIDIVAVNGGWLVFVEVKMRGSLVYGRPEEAVTPRKLKKIAKSGEWYMVHHHLADHLARIDVVAIDSDTGEIRLHVNVTG
jgi:putative endonuclease